MNTQALVSMVMCVYNAGQYLRPAIASVLGQTYQSLELILVDDGSTDGCIESAADLLSDSRVRVIRQANAGKPAAMNVALEQIKGEFYVVNDADDLSHPQRIERLIECMLQNPGVAAVYSGHEIILGEKRLAPTFAAKNVEDCKEIIQRYTMPAHDPTGMYRMSMVRDLRFDSSLLIGEGLDYMLRVGEQWPVLVLGECLYSYRIHWQSLTRKDPEQRDRLVAEALRRACSRRGDDFRVRFSHLRATTNGNAAQDNGIAAHFIESACDLKRVGRRWDAIKVGLHSARLHPLDFHYYKALIYAATPSSLVTSSRRVGS